MYTKVFALIVLLCCMGETTIAPNSQPHFGNGVVYLIPPHGGDLFMGALSPNGKFVVSTVAHEVVTGISWLYVWDLRRVNPDGSLTRPAPLVSFDLSPYVEADVSNPTWLDQDHLAVSPNSLSVAVLLKNELVLFSLPDLKIQNRLVFNEDKRNFSQATTIRWSIDGKLVAISNGHDYHVTVWEPETNKHYTNKSTFAEDFRYFADGWILSNNQGFTFCTPHLEKCTDYVSKRIFAFDQANQTFIEAPNVLWTHTKNGQFQRDPHYFAQLDAQPFGLSPDGRYLVTAVWGADGQPTSWAFHDAKTFKLLSTFTGWYHVITWLGKTGYYEHDALYHPSNSQPIDTYDGLDEPSTDEIVAHGVQPHWSGIYSVSEDGRWILYVPGATALVYPVIYN